MFKKLFLVLFVGMFSIGINLSSFAEENFVDEEIVEEVVDENDVELADAVSSDALMNYDVSGSLFEKITNLEQEKIVAQLEKERAQLDLDLERLNAERIKLQMELDTLSGRAEQQQQELEATKAQLEIQTEKLKRQMENLDNEEVGKKQKKTAIRIDMPYYFLHGDKTYILNSKERKNLIAWLNAEPIYKKGNEGENGEFPKNNWENLRNMWNRYYPQAKITCNQIDYSNLCKDYKQR